MADLSFRFHPLRLDLSVMEEQSIEAAEPSLRVRVGVQIDLPRGSVVCTFEDIWFDRPVWDSFSHQLTCLLRAEIAKVSLESSPYERDTNLNLHITRNEADFDLSVEIRHWVPNEEPIEPRYKVSLTTDDVEAMRKGFADYLRWW